MSQHRAPLRTTGIVVTTGLAFLLTVFPAAASVKGRKTTAAVLAGVAAYHLVKGHKTTALVAGAGAAYAWKRAKDAEKAQKRDRARRLRLARRHHHAVRHARVRVVETTRYYCHHHHKYHYARHYTYRSARR